MNAEWQMWAHDNNRLDPTSCAEIIHRAMKITPQRAEVGGRGVDESVRRSDLRWITWEHEEFRPLWELVERRIHTANRNAFGVDISYMHSLQFTEYDGAENGCFDWHMDTFFSEHARTRAYTLHRKLTCIVQLTAPDAYEGGRLEIEAFPPPDETELRRQGTMIVFPSFVRHRLHPVTSGVRHSLVTWMEGAQWR